MKLVSKFLKWLGIGVVILLLTIVGVVQIAMPVVEKMGGLRPSWPSEPQTFVGVTLGGPLSQLPVCGSGVTGVCLGKHLSDDIIEMGNAPKLDLGDDYKVGVIHYQGRVVSVFVAFDTEYWRQAQQIMTSRYGASHVPNLIWEERWVGGKTGITMNMRLGKKATIEAFDRELSRAFNTKTASAL